MPDLWECCYFLKRCVAAWRGGSYVYMFDLLSTGYLGEGLFRAALRQFALLHLYRLPRGGAVSGDVASICPITLISVTSRRFCFGRRYVNPRTIIHTGCTERKQVKKELRLPGGLSLNWLPRGCFVQWDVTPIRELLFIPVELRESLLERNYAGLGDYP